MTKEIRFMINFDVEVKFCTGQQITISEFVEYKEKWQEEHSCLKEDWEDYKEEILALWVQDNVEKCCDTGYSYGDEEVEVLEDSISEE